MFDFIQKGRFCHFPNSDIKAQIRLNVRTIKEQSKTQTSPRLQFFLDKALYVFHKKPGSRPSSRNSLIFGHNLVLKGHSHVAYVTSEVKDLR